MFVRLTNLLKGTIDYTQLINVNKLNKISEPNNALGKIFAGSTAAI